MPPGLPGIMSQPYPIEFLYQPDKIVMLLEAYMQFRHIYTDGRKHPEDPDLTFHGHSIGHWEKDTLVIDSVGFTESTLLASGVPHSDKLRIVERIRKVSPEWMEIEDHADRSGGAGRAVYQYHFLPAPRSTSFASTSALRTTVTAPMKKAAPTMNLE